MKLITFNLKNLNLFYNCYNEFDATIATKNPYPQIL